MPNIHLCLVSAQATPNITPVTDPRVAPRRVILLVSPDMRRRAAWLGDVLKGRGVRVEEWPVQDPWDVEQVQIRVLELLEREREALPDKAIALNATGGTKPMSIAAYEAFRAYDLPIFYVHPERDRLIWLHPMGRPALELADRLRLEAFLAVHGAAVEGEPLRAGPRRALVELAEGLVRDVSTLARPLRTLNWLAGRAERSLHTSMERRQAGDAALQPLIDRFARQGLVRRSGDRLAFPDEEARFYVNGGWLELLVFERLRRLRGGGGRIQDLARGVRVRRELRGEAVPNELDVACLADNRLYILECKTRVWKESGARGPGAEALYRLDTLVDLLGGLQARGMLVSYQDLPAHDRTRAADLRIRVCAGRDLLRLDEFLAGWIT